LADAANVNYLLAEHDNFDLQQPSRGGSWSRQEQRGHTGGGNPAGCFFRWRAADMGAIIVFAAIVGLVWAAVLLRFGSLIAGCLAVLLVGSVFGHAFFHVSAVTADRLLIVALLATTVAYQRVGLTDPTPFNKADICFTLFLAVLVLSTLTHDWRLDGAQPLATLLFFYLVPAVLYWVARQAPLGERAILAVFGFYTTFGAYLAITAIAESRHAWSLVFPSYIGSPMHTEFLGRGRGPFLNPVACGLYLSVGAFCTAQAWPRVRRTGRILTLLLIGLLLTGVYCTLTRSVWLGAGAGLLLIVGLVIPRTWRLPLALTLLVSAVPMAVWKGQDLNAFKRDQNVSVHEMSESARLRPILAAVAWKMFLDRPWFGCGFGQYKEADVDYLHQTVGDLPLRRARPYVQHNVFLALLTQTGLVGLSLLLMTLGLWALQAWRLWQARERPLWGRQFALVFMAVLVAYFCNGMFHDVGIITMVNALLFFTAGVSQKLVAHASPLPAAVARPAPADRSPSVGQASQGIAG